jgi:hypothetical protein
VTGEMRAATDEDVQSLHAIRECSPAPVAAPRRRDLLQLPDVEPDPVAALTGIDDDIAGAVVGMHVHL